MRKTIRIFVIATVLLLCLTGCSGKNSEPDPNAGVYTAESAEMFGVKMSVEEAFEGANFSVELLSGGKAKFNYENESHNMKWTLNGTEFTAKGGGAELSGTLENGVLIIRDLMGMGVDVKLVNKKLAAQAASSQEAAGDNILMNGTRIYFQNTLQTDIRSLYIGNGVVWSAPVNEETIAAGGNTLIDISDLPDGPGTYDVGATDVNGRNYDVYGVPLDGTRLVAITAAGDAAYIVLIDEDGQTETYEGKTYDSGESGN